MRVLARGWIVGAALLLCGCAVPASGGPMPSDAAQEQSAAEESSTEEPVPGETPDAETTHEEPGIADDEPDDVDSPAATATGIEPSVAPDVAATPSSVADGEWPPSLVFGDLKDAGVATYVVRHIRFQVPAGIAQVSSESSAMVFEGTGPGATGTGTIEVHDFPAGVSDAISLIDAIEAPIMRSAAIAVPGAASAMIGETRDGGTQTWVLAVVAPAGEAVTFTFSASVDDFEVLLLPQSLCSVKVLS